MIEEVKSLEINDVKIIKTKKFGDNRGFFSESYSKQNLEKHGINIDFVQDNHSFSEPQYTLRGLHFQNNPHAQDKLVRVTKGIIYDVAVDLRNNSTTFGKYVGTTISAEEWNQILVPKGFAHGFVTLTDNTEVLYKASNYYAPDSDNGIVWNDATLNIDWPLDGNAPIISEKDSRSPNFDINKSYF